MTDCEATLRGAATRSIEQTTPLLFRYSTLTFNGHRIHYDRDYAMKEEGFPGLVVHGPLLATLLYYHCADAKSNRCPDRFRFRGVAPLCDPDPFGLQAEMIDGGGMACRTVRSDGAIAMSGEVDWS